MPIPIAAIGEGLGIASQLAPVIADLFKKRTSGIQTESMSNPFGTNTFAYGGQMNKYAFGGEVEGNEVMTSPNTFKSYSGPTHENGGIPVDTNGNPYIFSNRIGFDKDKNLAYADIQVSLADKMKGLKKNLMRGDKISKNTKKIYSLMNEDVRTTMSNMTNMTNMKYSDGGPFPFNHDLFNKQLDRLARDIDSPIANNMVQPTMGLYSRQIGSTVKPITTSGNDAAPSLAPTNVGQLGKAPNVNGKLHDLSNDNKEASTISTIGNIAEGAMSLYNLGRGLFGKPRRMRPNYGATAATNTMLQANLSDKAAQQAITRSERAARQNFRTRSSNVWNALNTNLSANTQQSRATTSASFQNMRNQFLPAIARQQFFGGQADQQLDQYFAEGQREQQQYIDESMRRAYIGAKDYQNTQNQFKYNQMAISALAQRNPNFLINNYKQLLRNPNNLYDTRGIGE
jgi:hypothetical protein